VIRQIAIALMLALAAGVAAANAAPEFVAANPQPRFVDAGPRRVHARERLVEIQQRIQAALRYPPVPRSRGLEGTAVLRFDIEADGTPRDVVVHASSGLTSLDRAARAAVDDAAPLPWVYGRLEVPIVFALERRR
jgi:TonB family protein